MQQNEIYVSLPAVIRARSASGLATHHSSAGSHIGEGWPRAVLVSALLTKTKLPYSG